jgi:NADPH-dependent 2,4-dienoyl-CoA reductase/sulfur reductase-like enzyme/rhodanese-related sulfurtransferase/two-component sensor histidine kinase
MAVSLFYCSIYGPKMKELPNDPIQFAALVAHQLKGPIAAVSSLLQTVLGELAGPITPKQREILEKAISRCDESLAAAQRLLTISKAINNPKAFQGRADLVPIIRDAMDRYAQLFKNQHIEIKADFNLQSAMAVGNGAALSEVIEAMLSNAAKYTPDHGVVEIKVGSEDDKFKITVADSGIGIPQADMHKLFQPFYRSASARESSRPGTGLGLYYVKAIAEACGGSVSVGKAKIGGAEFVIELPAAKDEVSASGELIKGESKMPGLKVVIIGGVAAGPKVAAKIMRLMPDADVTIVEKGKLLSYAGCGFPYYISGVVKNQSELMSSSVGVVRDPIFFQKVKNIHIMNQTEAIEIDRKDKKVKVVDLTKRAESWLEYDKLVIATGSLPIIPKCQGLELDNIFTLHGPSDAEGIKAAVELTKAKDVVIVGGGLIGIEMTEALTKRGCRVSIVEKKNQILPMLDFEMAKLFENHLESQGVKVFTDSEVLSFESNGDKKQVNSVVCTAGDVPADIVIIAAGIKANTLLAEKAGLEIGSLGAIKVNMKMQTSDADIYAAGDCVESTDMITSKPCYIPLGSTANKQGRIVAVNICGGSDTFPGVLGTVGFKVFEFSMGRTGLSESGAKSLGYDAVSVLAPGPDMEHFVPGAKLLMLKIIADRKTGRLLGAQAMGPGEAIKRIDVASMAIMNNMTVYQLANADLCYAPPFSPVIDNIMTAANIAINKIEGYMDGISPLEFKENLDAGEDVYILDVRTPAEFDRVRLAGANLIPLASLRGRINEIPKDRPIITLCNVSLRGYEAAIILKSAGFENVKVLDGGLDMYPFEKIYV